MTARWVEHDHLPADQARWALVRGPLVYAVDNLWWDVKDIAAPHQVDQALALAAGQRGSIKQAPAPAGLLGPAYRAALTAGDGAVVEPLLVPFANVGVWYKDPAKKPDRNSAAYSYAVWLLAAESATFKQMAEAAEGHGRSPAPRHRPGADRRRRRPRRHISCRASPVPVASTAGPTATGKEFSYELKVATETPSDLIVTYWGSDKNREFDVLANDRVLATQKLANNQPDRFFEVRYRIPWELVKGKTNALGQKVDTVRIGFRGRSSIAGGVFGVRTEPAKP